MVHYLISLPRMQKTWAHSLLTHGYHAWFWTSRTELFSIMYSSKTSMCLPRGLATLLRCLQSSGGTRCAQLPCTDFTLLPQAGPQASSLLTKISVDGGCYNMYSKSHELVGFWSFTLYFHCYGSYMLIQIKMSLLTNEHVFLLKVFYFPKV